MTNGNISTDTDIHTGGDYDLLDEVDVHELCLWAEIVRAEWDAMRPSEQMELAREFEDAGR